MASTAHDERVPTLLVFHDDSGLLFEDRENKHAWIQAGRSVDLERFR